MGIGYILLLLFGGYVTLKFWETQQQVKKDASNRGAIQPGVSYYCNLAVSQRPAQVLAAQANNGDATTVNFAPAFGPTENMPGPNQEVWF
jgi:hypothetical protein